MGLTISVLYNYLFKNKPRTIVMVGTSLSGKTTILYYLKLGKFVNVMPTCGVNYETIEYKKTPLTIRDIGGEDTNRRVYSGFFPNTDGLIFVTNSNERHILESAKSELHSVLCDGDFHDSVVLVFDNKQDLPNSLSTAELAEELKLSTLKNRKWHIQASSAMNGDGIHEGMDWLLNEMAKKKN